MTSSLVGSEMCIRDSVLSVVDYDSTGELASTTHDGEEEYLWVMAFNAVSYTHLTLPTICSV
eukprot:3178165-Prorocentrum_lima.AAC.1